MQIHGVVPKVILFLVCAFLAALIAITAINWTSNLKDSVVTGAEGVIKSGTGMNIDIDGKEPEAAKDNGSQWENINDNLNTEDVNSLFNDAFVR